MERPDAFVAEHFCSTCGAPFLNSSPLDELGRCGICRTGEVGYDAVFAFGEYEGRLRKIVHLYKFGKVEPLGGVLAEWAIQALPREARFDVIVPAPLHWIRQWHRGFNQAEVVAGKISKRLRLPMVRALSRSRRTSQQAGLTSSQRRSNVAGAFVLRKGVSVRDRHVLLVDDVFTTGATAAACARVLKRAGAKRVSVLTVARADRRKSTSIVWELT